MSSVSPPAPYTDARRTAQDDADFDYFWSAGDLEVRVPEWLAEILDVPFMVRLELFLVGLCVGLVMAAFAVLIGFWSA